MDATDAMPTMTERSEAPAGRPDTGKKSFEQRFAEALRRRLYPRTRLRLKTLSRDTGYSEDTITRWTQAKHRVFAGAVEDMATYFATRFRDEGLLSEVFGLVAGWRAPASPVDAAPWPFAPDQPHAHAHTRAHEHAPMAAGEESAAL